MTSGTGQNDAAAQHTLGEIIAGGVTIHLLDTALAYGDGATEVGNKSVNSEAVAEADLTVNAATGFDGTATITNDNDVVFDVEANTETVVEVVLQNDTATDRVVLADEINNPNLDENDTYTIEAGTTLYEFGNPT